MTRRKLGLRLVGMSFALALVAVPACEYGQSGITVTRATEPSADVPALQQTPAAALATQSRQPVLTPSPHARS